MASPSEHPDGQGRKSPGNRKVPYALTTSFFSKGKKSADGRSPTMQSPTLSLGGSPVVTDAGAMPINIPGSPLNQGAPKNKKLAPSNSSFNTHYRNISRSMNDLGNIFSKGRSPPTREVSPARTAPLITVQESRRRGGANNVGGAHPQLAGTRAGEAHSVPSISVVQHGEQAREVAGREGWLNVVDSNTAKKGVLKDSWRLYHGLINDTYLYLYKPPSGLQIRAFDLGTAPSSPPRPQSAPATSSPAFASTSGLRHKSTFRHPELVFTEDGSIKSGSVEAMCHELMFTEDDDFVRTGVQTLPGWSGPETVLSVLMELAQLSNRSERLGKLMDNLLDVAPGLLLEPGFYNSARLLIEKGVAPHNSELAHSLRGLTEEKRSKLGNSLGIFDTPQEAKATTESFAQLSTVLRADEFMRINPETFATQIKMFHLKYFRAWSPNEDISLLLLPPHMPPPSHRNPLVFTTSHVHFLSERVFNHVLTGEAKSSVDARAAILSQWLKVARILRVNGDMVGYLAIITAALAPSILRLQETWTIVEPAMLEDARENGVKAMKILERRRLSAGRGRAPDGRVFVPKGVGSEISPRDAVPFFGDLCHCMDEAYGSRTVDVEYLKMTEGLRTLTDSLAKWRKEWADYKQDVKSKKSGEMKEIEQMQKCFHTLNANNQNPPSIESPSYFDQSLACEPAETGMYLHSHYHQKLPLSTGANVPLMFTSVLASFSLFHPYDTLAIAGSIQHKKTPSSGLATSAVTQAGPQANASLRPPTAGGSQALRRTNSFPPTATAGPLAQTTGYDELDYTTRERMAGLHSGDDAMLRAIRDVAGVGQKLFHSKDGELVLKAISEDPRSRPSSVIETTSNRASVASKRLSAHLQSGNESPRVSMHGETSQPVTPLRDGFEQKRAESSSMLVVPKGGTLERLVDILVLGVGEFSKRMSCSEGESTEFKLLQLDMDVFKITFFATFRSYCSPIVLIDYLKKRLVGSKSAATFSRDEREDVVFPDWTGVDHVNEESLDRELVAKIHMGILEAIHVWLSDFFIDFHCDQTLGESFVSFLEIAAREIEQWKDIKETDEDLGPYVQQINEKWRQINDIYRKLAFKPSVFVTPAWGERGSELCIPRADDLPAIEEFVSALDSRVREHIGAIQLIDWMVTFEILETQSSDPLGFFVPKTSYASHEDDEPIQDIFFLMSNLRRGSSSSVLLDTLPKCVRDFCTFHMEISGYILCQIVDPRIGLEERAWRIVTLLKVLAVCRKRMSVMDFYEHPDTGERRPVPSFVASAIAAALVRPESRMFGFAWQLAVSSLFGRSCSMETLEQIIPEEVGQLKHLAPMVPCVGWMVERMLEIVCYVPNMVPENNRLINFDKRRYVYNFINNLTVEAEKWPHEQLSKKKVYMPEPSSFEMRTIKDLSMRENQGARTGRIKVFTKLLHCEQEKLRRDAKQRDVLERQQRQQLRAEHRRQPTGTTMRADIAEKKGGKRLGVNSLFKAVRPISMAFTSGWTPPQSTARVVSPADLPPIRSLEQGRKLSAAIDLKTVASVTCGTGSREQLYWKIVSESGASYLLQATSEKDLEGWLSTIAAIRGTPVGDGGDSIDALTLMSQNRVSQQVFGVSLDELCKRDNTKVPAVVESLLTEIEARGLSEIGIYRVPGSLASINALKAALDNGEDVQMDDDRWYDINVIAGVFKAFMRELPEQTLSDEILAEMKKVTLETPEEEERINLYRDIMLKLPPPNYHFMRRVYFHFSRVAKMASANKMHAVNLAIVFGMGLSGNNDKAPFGFSPDLGVYQTMVKTWIMNAEAVFPEVEEPTQDASSSVLTGSEDSATDKQSEPPSPALPGFAEFRLSLDEPALGNSSIAVTSQ